jgi:RNA polymerase sigma-70 factor (ECF subfamily)
MEPIAVFEAERPRLLGLAYRMTGSRHDADDILQEAWLRFEHGGADLRSPAAWLTTVVTRLSIDRLRGIERERSHYVGPWLPEPTSLERTPDQIVDAANSLTLAFLVVLDRLSPLERAAFVLAEVFGEPYTSIASTLGRSEPACRQLVHRARTRVRAAGESTLRPLDEDLLHRLVSALLADEPEALLSLLSPDVVLVSDGGPQRRAARRSVVGPARVARFLTNISRREPGAMVVEGDVNFAACLFITGKDGLIVVTGGAQGDQIASLILMSNPGKVEGADLPRVMK